MAEIAAQRGPDNDEFTYFSLDLSSNSQARVKVYLRHYNATVDDLEKALSLAQNYVPGDATEFCQVMVSGQSIFSAKPVISCFSWIEGDNLTPSSAILHLPISNYVSNDLVVKNCLDQYFSQYGLPVSLYHSAIQSLTTRSLETGVGRHSYTSLRLDKQQRRVTIYLNPEVNSLQLPQRILAVQIERSLPSIEETSRNYQINSIEDHPFFQRLQRETVNQTYLWLLFVNCQEGIVSHFTRRLALVVAFIDNEHIRCILAKQLNEELGNGDISKVHRKIFERLMSALEPNKPEHITESMLAPGRTLGLRLEELYSDPNPYIGVGAAILMEIRGKQRDEIVGKELVRTTLDKSVLSWFHWHEALEIDHAEEVMDLARLIDSLDGEKKCVLQGAKMTSDALWHFCNGMYRVCFM